MMLPLASNPSTFVPMERPRQYLLNVPSPLMPQKVAVVTLCVRRKP